MNLFDTIRNTLVPIHKEGYIFVAAFFVASLVLGWIAEPLFWIGMVLTAGAPTSSAILNASRLRMTS